MSDDTLTGTVEQPPGVYTAMRVAGMAAQMPGACPYCSGPTSATFHGGSGCPRVAAIEYHPNGAVKRVELHPLPTPPERKGHHP